MELWVRSQNKEKFVKIDRVEYYEGYDPIDEYDGFTTHKIWANKEEIELGEYKTKERCLEIIDEIQKILQSKGLIIFKDIDISELKKEDLEPFKALGYSSSLNKLDNNDGEISINQLDTAVYEMPQE